jgi:hypothetical protein
MMAPALSQYHAYIDKSHVEAQIEICEALPAGKTIVLIVDSCIGFINPNPPTWARFFLTR